MRLPTQLAALVITIILLAPSKVLGQDVARFRIGAIAQKNAVLLPGFEVDYADPERFPRHLRFSAAYATSRLAVLFGSNGLVEDRFFFTSTWSFRPRRMVSPLAQVELGYTRFDREDEDIFALLDNDAFIASLLVGLEWQLLERRVSARADAGYSFLHSSTVYPFVASIGVFYLL